ncbi:2736_t:CDS:2, partial [Acaulospora colombiana]
MTQIHPLAIISNGGIWTVQQNNRTESTTTPKYALFRLRNLRGPIDEVALCNAILTSQDAREDFTFEVSDYDGTAATVRVVFNNTTHENLVQRLSIYSEIRNLSENGFYDWLPLDSATIQCMNPRPMIESTPSYEDQSIQIETVDRAIDQISSEDYNGNICFTSIFPGTTLTSSEDGQTSILWGESFRNIATTIKMLLVELEEAIGKTIISLSAGQYGNLNEHFRDMGEVLSRIRPFVERGKRELDELVEYVKKLQEKKDLADKIFRGAVT